METKLCGRCEQTKPVSDFHTRRLSTGTITYQPWCKECKRAWDREYARTNKRRRTRLASARRRTIDRGVEFLREYLSSHPCVDCGETDIVVLEFDHVRGKKEYPVTRLLTYSVEKMQEEIEKCEVRCANCHRRRHAVTDKSWRIS